MINYLSGITFNVRLEGGAASNSGRVEIQQGNTNTWGTIQDTSGSWDMNDARVICRMLGYSAAISTAQSGAPHPDPSVPIFYSFVDCTGGETTLLDCMLKFNEDGALTDHTADISVECRTYLALLKTIIMSPCL